ncbi:GIY-YIG nuclease family protein [Candidatus Saccharibacteria bacterium]|nr:GIY-YIG nuclease family protein [Candidatus Saccharibacteria bacterium]
MNNYYVYILASRANGTLYIGVTNNLRRRIYEHVHGLVPGFTTKYSVKRLVYFEQTDNIEVAINRENQLKNWHRQWKINLIEADNPDWNDLAITYGLDTETSSA